MSSRRARFKPVTSLPARRGKPETSVQQAQPAEVTDSAQAEQPEKKGTLPSQEADNPTECEAANLPQERAPPPPGEAAESSPPGPESSTPPKENPETANGKAAATPPNDCNPEKGSSAGEAGGGGGEVTSTAPVVSRLRGRRMKPAVNLPAATRKRAEPRIEPVAKADDVEDGATAVTPTSPPPIKSPPPRSVLANAKSPPPISVTTTATTIAAAAVASPDTPVPVADEEAPTASTAPTEDAAPPTAPPTAAAPPEAGPPKSDASARSSKDERKETSTGARQRRQPSNTAQRAQAARRSFMKRSGDDPPSRSSLTMFDLIFYNPSSNPMPNKSPPAVKNQSHQPSPMKPPPPEKIRSRQPSTCSVISMTEQRLQEEREDDVEEADQNKELEDEQHEDEERGEAAPPDTGSEDKENEEDAGSVMPVPRVKVGPDGRVIIDEQSLVIETTGTKKTREEMENSEVVIDTGLSNGFYKRSKRSKDWSHRETLKFYRALHVYGTDFSLMQALFKDRTRKELKLKFKKEERLRCSLIDKALCSPLDFDTTELEEEAQAEEEEEARLAKEKEEKEKENKEAPLPPPLKRKPKKPRPSSRVGLAQREMDLYQNISEDCDLAEGASPLKKRKLAKKPRAKPVGPPSKKGKTEENVARGLDVFGDDELAANAAAIAAAAIADAAIADAAKQKPPRKPPRKKQKQKPSDPAVNVPAPLHLTPQPSSSTATRPAAQTLGHVTVSSPPHPTLITPPSAGSAASSTGFVIVTGSSVASNEVRAPCFLSPRTPKTPLNVTVTRSISIPSEFGSPNRAPPVRTPPVPVQIPFAPTYSPTGLLTGGAIVPLQQTPSRVEPGSLYVLSTPCSDNPEKHVLRVYMVTDSQPTAKSTSPVEAQKLVQENNLETPQASTVTDPVAGTVLTKL